MNKVTWLVFIGMCASIMLGILAFILLTIAFSNNNINYFWASVISISGMLGLFFIVAHTKTYQGILSGELKENEY